jgi:hypothetical protein
LLFAAVLAAVVLCSVEAAFFVGFSCTLLMSAIEKVSPSAFTGAEAASQRQLKLRALCEGRQAKLSSQFVPYRHYQLAASSTGTDYSRIRAENTATGVVCSIGDK